MLKLHFVRFESLFRSILAHIIEDYARARETY